MAQKSTLKDICINVAGQVALNTTAQEIDNLIKQVAGKLGGTGGFTKGKGGGITMTFKEAGWKSDGGVSDLNIYNKRLGKFGGTAEIGEGVVTVTIPDLKVKEVGAVLQQIASGNLGGNLGGLYEAVFQEALIDELAYRWEGSAKELKGFTKEMNALSGRVDKELKGLKFRYDEAKVAAKAASAAARAYVQRYFLTQKEMQKALQEFANSGIQMGQASNTILGDYIGPNRVLEIKNYKLTMDGNKLTSSASSSLKWMETSDINLFGKSLIEAMGNRWWAGSSDDEFVSEMAKTLKNSIEEMVKNSSEETGAAVLKYILTKQRVFAGNGSTASEKAKKINLLGKENFSKKQVVITTNADGTKTIISRPLEELYNAAIKGQELKFDVVEQSSAQQLVAIHKGTQLLASIGLGDVEIEKIKTAPSPKGDSPTIRSVPLQTAIHSNLINLGAISILADTSQK